MFLMFRKADPCMSLLFLCHSPLPSGKLIPFVDALYSILVLDGVDSLPRNALSIFALERDDYLLQGAHFTLCLCEANYLLKVPLTPQEIMVLEGD